MVVPWDLLGTALVAAVAAAWWASRRMAAAGVPPPAEPTPAEAGGGAQAREALSDLTVTIALAALVAGRAVAVGIDLALSGVVPNWRAAVTLGAGLSTPGAVAGALIAGLWLVRRGRADTALWHAAVPAAAAGLAVWSVLALVRGDAGGVAAPFPLGWPLPLETVPRVPVALLEAAAYGTFALLAAGSGRISSLPGPRLAAALAGLVAAVHLIGSLARPSSPTADSDLDALLGLLVLAVAAAVAAGTPARAARLSGAAAALAGTALVSAAALGGGAADQLAPADGSGAPELEHAITAAAVPVRPPPAWDEEALAAFVAAGDRPVVVNFWASWCPPCHAEAPAVARVAGALGDEVTFLGVLVNDDPLRAAAFARRYGLPFPSVADGGLRGPLGAPGLPATVVLRPDGSVAARVVGGLDARGLAAAIDRADEG